MSIDLPTDLDADGKPIPRPFARFVWLWTGCCPGTMNHAYWCGCGNPDDVYIFVRNAMNALPWYESKFFDAYPPGVSDLLAGVLDNMGLVEHGGSWRGSWATDLGKEFIQIAGKMTDDEIWSEVAAADAADVSGCYVDDCPNCTRWGKKG